MALNTDTNPLKVNDSVFIRSHTCLLVSVGLLGGLCASRGWGRNTSPDTTLDWSKLVYRFSSHAGDGVSGASGQHGPRQCGHRNRCGLYNNLLYSDKVGFPNWSAGGNT